MAAEARCWLKARTSILKSPDSFLICSMSPIRTSRAGFAGWRLERTRCSSQALEACSRVLKKRAAQSHLSMRVPVMRLFSALAADFENALDGSEHAAREREERGDEFECASDYDAYEAEGQE